MRYSSGRYVDKNWASFPRFRPAPISIKFVPSSPFHHVIAATAHWLGLIPLFIFRVESSFHSEYWSSLVPLLTAALPSLVRAAAKMRNTVMAIINPKGQKTKPPTDQHETTIVWSQCLADRRVWQQWCLKYPIASLTLECSSPWGTVLSGTHMWPLLSPSI